MWDLVEEQVPLGGVVMLLSQSKCGRHSLREMADEIGWWWGP